MKSFLSAIHLAAALCFCTSFVSAQAQESSQINGFFVQAIKGHATCLAVSVNGFPVAFTVRTNRPDVFFDQIKNAQKCVRETRMLVNKKQDERHTFFTQPLPEPVGTFLHGEYGPILCRKFLTSGGRDAIYEFSFPSMDAEEIHALVHETPMRICLNSVKPVSPQQEENLRRHPSILPA